MFRPEKEPLYMIGIPNSHHGGYGLKVLHTSAEGYMLESGKSKHRRKPMKHKLTVLLCLAVITITSIVSIVSYTHYTAWRNQQRAKAIATSAAEVKQSALQQAIFNNEVKQLETQCSQDQHNYSLLTPAEKLKATAPNCDTNLVQ